MQGLTYGAELELADLDRTKPLLPGQCWDIKDFSMVNSNGIAVDPKGISWAKGGEICMRPENSPRELLLQFGNTKVLFPEMKVNYRSNLHVHVRIPGLKDDLAELKRLQLFIHDWFKPWIGVLEPIPSPKAHSRAELESEEHKGAMARFRRRHKSHQTFLTSKRVAYQQEAKTVQEFMEREVPKSKAGAVMWHAQSRCCVNIRQLRETDTIEFRHFPGTTNPQEFLAAVEWVEHFTRLFLTGAPPKALEQAVHEFAPRLPKFEPYCHWQELRYKRTTCDGSVKREDREQAIKEILEEDALKP